MSSSETILSPSSRRHWRAADGAALVAAFQSSGQSRAAFCAGQGIGAWRLAYWLRRSVANEFGDAPCAQGFCEVTAGLASSTLTVTVGGAQVMVRAGFDPGLLRLVVAALS